MMQMIKDKIECNNILVVDDDPEELLGTSRILRKAGYIVGEANSGEEAIKKAKQSTPDLILLDVVMPGMDGFETCKKIKEDHQLKETFIVLLSSIKKTPDYKAQGLNAGADGFIGRPFHSKEFNSRIRSIMRIKSVEKELRMQRQWLRITLSSIGDGLIATDDVGHILFMNPVAERITGWPTKEAYLKNVGEIFNIIDSTTKRPIKGPIDKVLKEGTIVQLDDNVLLITKNQKQVPVADSASPILDDSGGIVGGVLVFRDITEKIRSEKEISQALKDWGAMFRAIGQMTLIIDPKHGILDANDVALMKTGLSREQIIGKKCFEIIHGASSPPEKCPMVKALKTGRQEASSIKNGKNRRRLFYFMHPRF
jgi:PAS domain S-box-containing protein